MTKAAGFTLFIFGAILGAGSAWYLTKKKYEFIADEEIASVKKAYSEKATVNVSQRIEHVKCDDISEEVKTNYKDISKQYVSAPTESDEEKSTYTDPVPYIITPDDFAGNFEFDTIEYTYYEDGVMTDENDEPLEEDDINSNVGKDATKHFGEYENDIVYVRNDRLKCDFEIVRDIRRYSEISKPHYTED